MHRKNRWVRTAWCACYLLCLAPALRAQLIVAHRGASYDAPENTLAAFQLAWRHQADAIEGDYYLTRDQQIICIHDATTERVARVSLSVPQSSLADLQQLDVGGWKAPRFAGLHMPCLSEVLACVPRQKRAFLEIKCGPEIVPFLQRELETSALSAGQTTIISFQAEVIQAVKTAMPKRQAYWLTGFDKNKRSSGWSPTCAEVIRTAKRVKADGVDLAGNREVVDQDFIARCRQAGLSVHVWTIDDPEKALHFQRLGVDSITTNRPSELRRVLFPSTPVPINGVPAATAVPQTETPAAVP